jgi:ribose transport system permease protein
MIEKRRNRLVKGLLFEHNVFLVLAVLVVVSVFLSDVFFTWGNITNLLRQLVPTMLVSMGMIVVVLTGAIDLSVGSVTAVASVTTAKLISEVFKDSGVLALILSIVIALIVAVITGAMTGALVAFFRIAPFVASLAMMTIARGVAYIITNGEPIRYDPNSPAGQVLDFYGGKSIPVIGLPYPILVGLIVVVLFYLVFKHTAFGRLVIATGSNESAVRLAGINVEKYKFLVYVISGLMCGLAGITITARSGVGVPITGNGLELDALAACVIGGASLNGGKGKIINTAMGVLVLGLVSNIMNLVSVPVYPQQIIKGVIIIIAVLTQGIRKEE